MNATLFNFAEHIFILNKSRASKLAFIDDTRTLTYGELERQARRTAASLIQLGLRREERVFVLMHDNVDWPVAFLGCMYAGIVPVAVNTLLPADDLAYMLAHSRSRAAIVSEALLPTFNEALAKSPAHEVQHTFISKPALSQAFIDKVCGPMASPAPTHPDDIGFWLYSSGSTGKPKGTVHTHGSPWWTAELYGKGVLNIQEGDVLFSAAKLFFAYGLGNALSFPLLAGATVVLLPGRPTPQEVFRLWTDAGVTVFFGASTSVTGYTRPFASKTCVMPIFLPIKPIMTSKSFHEVACRLARHRRSERVLPRS